MTVMTPRCIQTVDPLGVDVEWPALNWTVRSEARGDRQRAYQVLVASTAALLDTDQGDLWDTGQVESNATFNINYAGTPLHSGQQCFWKVRVWDASDRPSPWSVNGTWTMALLHPGDWKGQWIQEPGDAAITQPINRPLPLFRRAIVVQKPLKRAIVNVCGLGQFELSVNGQKVGDRQLDPGWSDYRKTCLYVTFDITAQMRPRDNAIGVMLGNGMFNIPPVKTRYAKMHGTFGQPMLIAQINLTFADGSAETISTDQQWRALPGPITYSGEYGGEDFDARLLPAGWDRPSFDDRFWSPAVVVKGPGGTLHGLSRSAPPLQIAQTFTPRTTSEPKPGVFVYDFGQNASAIPHISLIGQSGSSVKLTPGELLENEGTVSQQSSGSPAWFTYTLGDEPGTQHWSPRFTYYGSRYLQIDHAIPKGKPNPDRLPVIEEVSSGFVTSSSPMVGEFSCSNDLFNRTYAIIRAAMRSNLQSIVTDCPHREKLGWLEQTHLVGPSLMYNFDIQRLFSKMCDDMADAQTEDGLIPDIAPEFARFKGGFRDSPEWGSAAILIPWQIYQFYGDEAVLRTHYEMMVRYVAYLGTRATDHILSHGLGDWYDLGPQRPGEAQLTPKPLTATAFYFRDAQLLAHIARLLSKDEDAGRYESLAAEIRTAFTCQFYDAVNHRYATGSQTANAIPLVFELVPSDDRAAVLGSLLADIRSHDSRLTAGDIGYRYVLRALADGGRSDVIYAMNSRSDRPGYGYILARGATTLTEGWDGSSSQNHFMLGHIMEWFYSDLAGIKLAPDAVAFDKIIIHPTPVGDVKWARAKYDSVRGPIVSSWKIVGGQFMLDLTIPIGSIAYVRLPETTLADVTEDGKPLHDIAGITFPVEDVDGVECVAGSGTYHFVATIKIA